MIEPHNVLQFPDLLSELQQAKQDASKPSPLSTGDGGGTYGGMEMRVTRLETHFEYVRRDLDEIKGGQAQIQSDLQSVVASLKNLPTKNDLWSWKLQWIAIAVGAIALIVGGIIGGLSWVKPEPQQVVISVPPATPPPSAE
jgi:hypothetical protein